jgi:23S rRNA (adenine2503-C2)-methyltransferase
MTKKNVKDLTLSEFKAEMEGLAEPGYRALQVFNWIYRRGATDFDQFSNLPRMLRERLSARFFLSRLDLFGQLEALDLTEKFLFRLEDGNFIETVFIPSPGRTTLCLSTQVGCKFACAFCASGLKGFGRNLTTGEILDQILAVKFGLGRELTNFVFMGMGEPFDNFENVAKAIRVMNSTEGMAIAARRITVSTSGVVPGIEKFKKLDLQVRLSLSLHAPNDELRRTLMPIGRKYPLERVLRACLDYIRETGRTMTIEYVLLAGLNDSPGDADALARIAMRLKAKVNLLPYSPVQGLSFKTPSASAVESFSQRLAARNVKATIRRSKGRDILAACGQLAGRRDN